MDTVSSRTRRSRLGLHVSIGLSVVGVLAIIVGVRALTASPPDFDKLCAEGQPYFVAAAYRAQSATGKAPDMGAASVILFGDTPSDRPHYTLATYAETGAVWGLAYRSAEPAIYAAAYHKRGLPYGPGGPGAIYRIDLAAGEVRQFLTVPDAGGIQSGGQLPDGKLDFGENDMSAVGKTALGALELSADESELYVTNLHDRRIYRYAMPGGSPLGSFDHGASKEPWAGEARPFALMAHAGWLYHGVVNSMGQGAAFVAKVYRSKADGSDMAEVASLDLGYPRDAMRLPSVSGGNLSWRAWVDDIDQAPVVVPTWMPIRQEGRPFPPPVYEPRLHAPQPMFTDIALTADEDLVIALRDRYVDMQLQWVKEERETVYGGFYRTGTPPPTPVRAISVVMSGEALGFGDILRGQATPSAGWGLQTKPEHFDDANDVRHAESAFGGVAWVPGTDKVVSTHFGVNRSSSDTVIAEEGVYWYQVASGNKVGVESVGKPASLLPYTELLRAQALVWADNEEPPPIAYNGVRVTTLLRDVGSLGDVEVLCGMQSDLPTDPPPTATPTATPTEAPPTPSDTPAPATDTPSPAPTTATPPSPTALPTTPSAPPTPTRGPAYLPLLLREHCDPTRVRADVVLVLDASSSMTGAKLAAAKAAALAFIRAMRLPDDQVGLVAFNETATVLSPLSGDRAALEGAIDGIAVAVGTRIDTGIEAARTVLAGPERVAAHSPVVVVMTDGIQSADPERPLALADRLRAEGVELHVVGLGTDVDAGYLARLAGESGRLHLSPTPEALAGVYERIARLIPCPAGGFWGGR